MSHVPHFGFSDAPQYGYNGDGLRMTKSQGLGNVNLTWDIGVEAGLPLLLQDATGSYIYGPGGMLVEQIEPAIRPYVQVSAVK